MKKVLFLFILSLVFPVLSYAGSYQGSLTVNRLWHDSSKVYFGFTSTPSDCSSSWYSAHAYLSTSHAAYKGLLSILLTARSTNKQVDIWYTDHGDCSSSSSQLLEITGIGFSKE